jgi:hypothetical protein
VKKPTLRATRRVLHWLSGEWILVDWEVPNGGAVVFLRSVLVSFTVFATAIGTINVLDPSRTFEFSFFELRLQIIEYLSWLGVIFAGAYTAFYTRFASQWSYLAELYNNIKATEVAGAQDRKALAEWKAGFIEDAQTLHMECKSSFLSIVADWLEEPDVVKAFAEKTIAGAARLEDLKRNLGFSRKLAEDTYQARLGPKTTEGRSKNAV